MTENKSFQIRTSSVKIPHFYPIHEHHRHRRPLPLFADLHLSASSILNSCRHSVTEFISSITSHNLINKFQQNAQNPPKLSNPFHSKKSPLLCSASLALTRVDEEGGEATQSSKIHSQSRHDDDRVLISEVLVMNKDGEELERKDLEEEAIAALKTCRPNSALMNQTKISRGWYVREPTFCQQNL